MTAAEERRFNELTMRYIRLQATLRQANKDLEKLAELINSQYKDNKTLEEIEEIIKQLSWIDS